TMPDPWVDRAADIIGGAIAHDVDRAGVRVDLYLAGRAAVGVAASRERHVALRRQRTAQRVVQIVEFLRGARDLEQADDAPRALRLERAIREFDVLRLDFEHVGRDPAAAL